MKHVPLRSVTIVLYELSSRSSSLAPDHTSPPQQDASRPLIQSLSLSRTSPHCARDQNSCIWTPHSHVHKSSPHSSPYSRVWPQLRPTDSGPISIVTRSVSSSPDKFSLFSFAFVLSTRFKLFPAVVTLTHLLTEVFILHARGSSLASHPNTLSLPPSLSHSVALFLTLSGLLPRTSHFPSRILNLLCSPSSVMTCLHPALMAQAFLHPASKSRLA